MPGVAKHEYFNVSKILIPPIPFMRLSVYVHTTHVKVFSVQLGVLESVPYTAEIAVLSVEPYISENTQLSIHSIEFSMRSSVEDNTQHIF